MQESKPNLNELIRYIRACHPDFLLSSEEISCKAIFNDTMKNLSINVELSVLENIDKLDEDSKSLLMILMYLLSHSWFRKESEHYQLDCNILLDEITKLSPYLKQQDVINEQERAEEVLRLVLAIIQVFPEGESQDEFQSKWESLSTLYHLSLAEAAQEAQDRALKVLEQIRIAESADAAAKVSRE